MNLFAVGHSAAGVDPAAARRALAALLEALPFFPRSTPASWSSGHAALVWVQHPPDDVGGVEYVHTEPGRFALFTGRPFVWTDQLEASGRAAIDPRFFLDGFSDALDGRWAAARYDGRALEVSSDRTGAYPLFEAEIDGAHWFSNSAELLRSLLGTRTLSVNVLASVLGGGWSLTGDPAWSEVKRLAAGATARLTAERRETAAPREDRGPIGGGFDAARAGALLTAATGALADWPGRPSVIPITGGRDSRLVLAGALAAGLEFTTTTGAVPGSRDVEIGRALAAAAGVEHTLIPDDPGGSLSGDWRRAGALLELTAAGTSSLSDAAGYPFGPRPGPLPLWHSGQGGEVARAYYGLGDGLSRGALVDRLYRAFVGRRPGRSELLSAAGAETVRRHIEEFVDSRLERGVDATDVPDLFYLERRMGTWAGPTHGCVEYVRDTTSPLWSTRLLGPELGLEAPMRRAEAFHFELLRTLAPALLEIPYEDGVLPGSRKRARRSLARKVAGEVRRRLARRTASPGDPFDRIVGEVRELITGQRDHPAWEALDRGRVESLLAAPAASLDTMSRYYVWRLATVFTLTR